MAKPDAELRPLEPLPILDPTQATRPAPDMTLASEHLPLAPVALAPVTENIAPQAPPLLGIQPVLAPETPMSEPRDVEPMAALEPTPVVPQVAPSPARASLPDAAPSERKPRTGLIVGLCVVALMAVLALLLLTRPSDEAQTIVVTPPLSPEPLTDTLPVLPPVATARAAADLPASVPQPQTQAPTEPQGATPPVAVRPTLPRPAPQSAPAPTPAPAASQPAPSVELTPAPRTADLAPAVTAPLDGQGPTQARPGPSDPNAPIVTRPQNLDPQT